MSGTYDSPRLNLSPTEVTYMHLQEVYSMDGQLVDHLPDMVEVIRCKDCKHWYLDADTGMACEFTNMGQPEDGFCNWAEKKGERNDTY